MAPASRRVVAVASYMLIWRLDAFENTAIPALPLAIGIAFVFDFDGAFPTAAPGLAKPDRFAGDGHVPGKTGLTVAHAETEENTEGVGIGEGEDTCPLRHCGSRMDRR